MRNSNRLVVALVLLIGVGVGILAGAGAGAGIVAQPASAFETQRLREVEPTTTTDRAEARPTAAQGSGGSHLVRVVFPMSLNPNVQSVGVWGTCDETVPSEECVFTVEAVKYHRSPNEGGDTKFNIVCVDLSEYPNFSDDVPSCSPLERESLGFSVGFPIGAEFGAAGGVAAGVDAEATMTYGVEFDFAASFPIHRRFRYPMRRPLTVGSLGGNLLIETGVGSIVAGKSVMFGHTAFTGNVVFFITKPVGMSLLFGSFGPNGAQCFDGGPTDCPADAPGSFTAALHHVCEIGNEPGGCGEETVAARYRTRAGEVQSDFELQELADALDVQRQTISDILDEIKRRMRERITEVFDSMRAQLNDGGGAAAGQRSVVVDQVMAMLRERITENLREIRDIARDLVACPD